MNPIRSLEELQDYWVRRGNESAIYAFFLYSDEDTTIVHYVRKYFLEIDRMTGPDCRVFLVEKPPKNWLEEAETREYWKEYNDKDFWEGFRTVKPYKEGEAYSIAIKLGIPIDSLPCIVFFKDLNSYELLVYKIINKSEPEQITRELRELFAVTNRRFLTDKSLGARRMIIWDDIGRYISSKNTKLMLIKLLRPIEYIFKTIKGNSEIELDINGRFR